MVGGKVVVVLVVVVVVGAGVVVVVVVVVVGQTCEREKSKSTSQIVTHALPLHETRNDLKGKTKATVTYLNDK